MQINPNFHCYRCFLPKKTGRKWIPGKGWDDGPDVYSMAKYTKNTHRSAQRNDSSSGDGDLRMQTLANDGQYVSLLIT